MAELRTTGCMMVAGWDPDAARALIEGRGLQAERSTPVVRQLAGNCHTQWYSELLRQTNLPASWKRVGGHTALT